MLKKVLIGIVGLCALLAVIGLLLPRTVRVERSILIARPPAAVFAVVNDQRQFNAWSPWFGLDPAAKYELSGPPIGPGAAFSWSGSSDTIGVGTQRIVASVPDSRIDVVLEMEGFNAAASHWQFEPTAEGTRVTWAFESELGLNPLMRWMGLFMDGFVGPDYARGLAQLKTYIEKAPGAGG